MKAPLIFCSASHGINIHKIFKIVLAKVFDIKCTVAQITTVGDPIIEYENNATAELTEDDTTPNTTSDTNSTNTHIQHMSHHSITETDQETENDTEQTDQTDLQNKHLATHQHTNSTDQTQEKTSNTST